MNNQKPFLLAGSIILGIIALALVFMAGRMSGGFERFEGRGMRRNEMMRDFGGKGDFGGRGERGMNGAMQFIDESSLTSDQKSQLEKIKDDQQQKMQDLMQSFRTGSGTSQTEMTTKVEALWKEHMAALRPFVAQTQLSGFDAFVAAGKPQLPMMGGKGKNW